MKASGSVALAVIVASGALLSGCAATRAVGRGADRVGDGLGAALMAPLEDLNLKRTEIPRVLLDAGRAPYATRGLRRCDQVAAEVRRLDEALGPDLDEPPPPDDREMSEVGADVAADLTLDAVRDTTTGVIPLRGWVRQLTGAQRHSSRVQNAIQAGRTRRGFLKGYGMRMNCAPPAAPSWFRPAPRVRVAAPPARKRPQSSRGR